MNATKITVTGGAGFIGSHLVERLLERGAEVTVLDNLSTSDVGNLGGMVDDIRFIEGDIRDRETVRKAVRGADTVFHEAALGSVPRSIEDPLTSNEINVEGTLNVLIAARDEGVRRMVFASSSSVYGDTPTLPKQEDMSPTPTSPYGVTKLAAEMYCRAFTPVYGLETVSLRYFNVFGPRQDPESMYAAVIPRFTTRFLENQSPEIYGDGEQSRDFTYVANVVDANLLAMSTTTGIGGAFNVAAGDPITLNELAVRLKQLTGAKVDVTYSESRPGDIRHSFADIGAARSALGFEPGVTLSEGLNLTVEWYTAELSRATAAV